MRTIGIAVTVTLLAGITTALAQQPGGAMKAFASSADVQAMIAKAKSTRKQDQPTVSQPILQLAPYSANLEYRAAVGPAAVHKTEAEMFYVVDGSGTLVTGGKLTAETQPNPQNLSGTGIEGGKPQDVAKGDFIMVPENTPHWFSKINGTLILMSIHLPHSGK